MIRRSLQTPYVKKKVSRGTSIPSGFCYTFHKGIEKCQNQNFAFSHACFKSKRGNIQNAGPKHPFKDNNKIWVKTIPFETNKKMTVNQEKLTCKKLRKLLNRF